MLLTLTAVTHIRAQSPEVMLCKTWKLIQYEESGTTFPPDESQQKDRMIFKPDHTTQSIESGSVQKGIWKYSPATKIIEIVDNSTKEKSVLKVCFAFFKATSAGI